MSRLEQLFNTAVAEFQNGRFSEAEKALQKIGRKHRHIPDILHLQGLIALETGKLKQAADSFRQLVRAQKNNAEYHALLGTALLMADREKQAVAAFDNAIALDPDKADHHYNRGLARKRLQEFTAAEQGFREALRLSPDHLDARFELGLVLRQAQKLEQALDSFERVLKQDPESVDGMTEMAECLIGLQRFSEALPLLQNAEALDPESVPILNALGIVNYYLKNYEDSERAFQKALSREPDTFQLHNALGNLYHRIGRLSDAEQCFRNAMARSTQVTEANLNLAGLLLLNGAYGEGWRLFENMRGVAYGGAVPQAPWNGEDLSDKTIRVYGYQGVGDVVMFAGLLPELQSRCRQAIVEIDERLMPLFQRSFEGVEIISAPRGSLPARNEDRFDFETIFSELPRFLRTNLAAASPPERGHLTADREKSETIRDRYLAGESKTLVGIAWHSHNVKRPERNLPLSLWGPILTLPNVTFVSLQYGDAKADIAGAERRFGTTILNDPQIDQSANLDDLASQIDALDLVVSISQASAHFAGALGKRVLTMLPRVPDWRYGLERHDTIWYPHMTLYRQSETDVWDDVIAAVAAEIAKITSR